MTTTIKVLLLAFVSAGLIFAGNSTQKSCVFYENDGWYCPKGVAVSELGHPPRENTVKSTESVVDGSPRGDLE